MRYFLYLAIATIAFGSIFNSFSQTTETDQSVVMPSIATEQVLDDFDVSRISKFSGFWNNLNDGSINNFEFNNFKIDESSFTADARILAAGRGNSQCNIISHIAGKLSGNTIFIYIDNKNQRCFKNYSITLNLKSKDGTFEYETLNFFSRKMVGQYRIIDIN